MFLTKVLGEDKEEEEVNSVVANLIHVVFPK
jgi:hypothetical protein